MPALPPSPPAAPPRQGGFSLVELLIAVVVTLIITGAVFGLMLSGQSAFRREPHATDRQQNVRIAMDLIQRDLTTAGMGLPANVQVFRPGLDADSGAPASGSGQQPDQLELIGADGTCPTMDVCENTSSQYVPRQPVTASPPAPTCLFSSADKLVFLCAGGGCYGTGPNPALAWLNPAGGSTGTCPAGGGASRNGLGMTDTSTQFGGTVAPGFSGTPSSMSGAFNGGTATPVQVVRYRIREESPGSGIPSLYRSVTGGANSQGAAQDQNYQLVARGIDDFQVEYQAGPAAFAAVPPTVNCSNPQCTDAPGHDTIVRQVRVTLMAKTILQEGAGAPGAPAQRYSELTTTTTPRVVLFHLTRTSPSPAWH
jgi:type II secretory pathway pseudopilin PulG